MSAEIRLTSVSAQERPTLIRYLVLAVATLMALLLYLDRFALSVALEYIREDLRMTQSQMGWFVSAFFWSYALAQVPAGLFSDRFGARRMLTIYILAWSVFTGLLGMAHRVWQVLQARLLFGLAQAGAYPTAGGLIRLWFPISSRGVANSIVALGGRAGGVLAPLLTAWLISIFAASADPADFTEADIVDGSKFVRSFDPLSEDRAKPRIADRVADRIRSRLSTEAETLLVEYVQNRRDGTFPNASSLKDSGVTIWGIQLNWRDWFPGGDPSRSREFKWDGEFLKQIGIVLEQRDLFDGMEFNASKPLPTVTAGSARAPLATPPPQAGLKLPPKAESLLQQRGNSASLSKTDVTQLNRLIFETAFAGSVKQYIGAGWRPTVMLYGCVGIGVALIFLLVSRNTPQGHPWCNPAERSLINDEATRAVMAAEPADSPFPRRAILTSLSLWGNSLMQVFTNIGWVFVVTWLPRYLNKVHGVPLAGQAIMTAIPTAAGILGMYAGGWWTDRATIQYGRKWGRRVPVVVTRFTAGAGYGFCLLLSFCFTPDPSNTWLPWAYVAALCLMVFSVDMGNPAVWAYAQDVGGKFTGSVLGWANMWGNLGAAVAPLIYNRLLGEDPTFAQWNTMFGLCLMAFVLSGLCGLVMDSTKPLIEDTVPPTAACI